MASKLDTGHDPKKVPDASPDCPRCHYWASKAEELSARARAAAPAYPNGIDQAIAAEILTKAFPQRPRSH